jgi:dCMP deaminase
MRKSWDQYFIEIAEKAAERSTCDRLHVGALIVKDNRIISTGYNGSVRGLDHCTDSSENICDGGCLSNEGRCVRTIHAEANAILHANRDDLIGSTCFVTHEPCETCMKLLAQSGITRVVFLHAYNNKYNIYFTGNIELVHCVRGDTDD